MPLAQQPGGICWRGTWKVEGVFRKPSPLRDPFANLEHLVVGLPKLRREDQGAGGLGTFTRLGT